MADKMNPQQFAATIRAKHPGAYDDISDTDLTQKVLTKYPEYSDMVDGSAPKPDNSIWAGVKEFASELNPVKALTGLRDAAAHPIDTLTADANARQQILDKGKAQLKAGDYAGGAANTLYGLIPFVGEGLANRGQQFVQGDTAKAIGGSLGMGVNLAAPALAKNVAIPLAGKASEFIKGQAADLYQSALKPANTAKAIRSGVNDTAVQTGLDQGITVSKDGLAKLADKIAETNQKMSDAIPTGTGQTINKYAVASRLTPLAEDAAKQVNPGADLRSISKAGQEFINSNPMQIPVEDAAALKSGTYQSLGNKAYGELKGASIEAQKTLARGLKEELINQFPELKGLGQLDQQLYQLQPMLEKAAARIGNHQVFGIGTPAVALGTEALTHSWKATLAASAAKLIVDQPAIKSRLAIMLQKAGNAQGVTLPLARLKVQAYINALGQTASQATKQPANAQ